MSSPSSLVVFPLLVCLACYSYGAEGVSGNSPSQSHPPAKAFPENLADLVQEAETLTRSGYCRVLFGDVPIDPEHLRKIRFRVVRRLTDADAGGLGDLRKGTIVYAFVIDGVKDLVIVTPKVATLPRRRVAALLAHEVHLHLLLGISDEAGMRVLCPKNQHGSSCITDQIAAGCPQLRNKSPGRVLAEAYRPQLPLRDHKQRTHGVTA